MTHWEYVEKYVLPLVFKSKGSNEKKLLGILMDAHVKYLGELFDEGHLSRADRTKTAFEFIEKSKGYLLQCS